MSEADRKATMAACHADPRAWLLAVMGPALDGYAQGWAGKPVRSWADIPLAEREGILAACQTMWGFMQEPVEAIMNEALAPVRAALAEGDAARALEIMDRMQP